MSSSMKTTYTHCPICVQGCGLAVSSTDNKVVDIQPDKNNPKWRDYCIKGAKSHETLNHPKRLTSPMKRVNGRYVSVPYRQAIDEIAQHLSRIIDESGADSVASYLGNPGMSNFGSTAFLNLFMAAIGSQSKYTVASIDHNPTYVVFKAMYGNPRSQLQPDIDHCRYLLIVGSNPAVSELTWTYTIRSGWKRALKAKEENRLEIVVVDPRTTESARKASRHIAPLPETDWAVLLGMIKVIIENRWYAKDIEEQVNDFDTLRQLVAETSLAELSKRCDVPAADIEALAKGFANAPAAISLCNTGPCQTTTGTVTLWLSQVLNLITGNLSRQGGLYHTRGSLNLVKNGAATFPSKEVVSRVRQLRGVEGAFSLAELPDEINTPGPGQVRALIIDGGNPVISGPDGKALDEALQKLDLLIAVDLFQRESHRHAHWLIPAAHFLELEELNIPINEVAGEPYLKLLKKAVDKPAGVAYEWEFFRDLALKMDKPFLRGKKRLNSYIKATIWWSRLTGNPYDSFSPKTIAKALLKNGGATTYQKVEEAEHGLSLNETPDFNYFLANLGTHNGKPNAAPAAFVTEMRRLMATPEQRIDQQEFPLQLINRRRIHMMNSWLTETSMKSMKERGGDVIDINPRDAAKLSLLDGHRVKVSSATNSVEAVLRVTDTVRPGVAVMGHGWGSRTFSPQTGEPAEAEGVNRNLLVSNKHLDPFTGVPRLNGTPIAVQSMP